MISNPVSLNAELAGNCLNFYRLTTETVYKKLCLAKQSKKTFFGTTNSSIRSLVNPFQGVFQGGDDRYFLEEKTHMEGAGSCAMKYVTSKPLPWVPRICGSTATNLQTLDKSFAVFMGSVIQLAVQLNEFCCNTGLENIEWQMLEHLLKKAVLESFWNTLSNTVYKAIFQPVNYYDDGTMKTQTFDSETAKKTITLDSALSVAKLFKEIAQLSTDAECGDNVWFIPESFLGFLIGLFQSTVHCCGAFSIAGDESQKRMSIYHFEQFGSNIMVVPLPDEEFDKDNSQNWITPVVKMGGVVFWVKRVMPNRLASELKLHYNSNVINMTDIGYDQYMKSGGNPEYITSMPMSPITILGAGFDSGINFNSQLFFGTMIGAGRIPDSVWKVLVPSSPTVAPAPAPAPQADRPVILPKPDEVTISLDQLTQFKSIIETANQRITELESKLGKEHTQPVATDSMDDQSVAPEPTPEVTSEATIEKGRKK